MFGEKDRNDEDKSYELPSQIDLETYFTLNKKNPNTKKMDFLAKYLFRTAFTSNIKSTDFLTLYEECAKEDRLYVDLEFPPNVSSLIKGVGAANQNRKWKKIRWERASKYLDNYTIFPPKFKPRQIVQGALNNNSFLSIVAALAENSRLIKSMFITDTVNKYGIYGVYLCKDGRYKQYNIDDYFPCDNKLGSECFSHGIKGTIWVQILEKCYAKAYGSYSSIETKDLDKILQDLTCAPIITLDKLVKSLYLSLEEANKNGWLILASAGETESSQELLKEIGLIPSHAYAILNVFRINENIEHPTDTTNMTEKEAESIDLNILLQIRNHWAKDGWLGDWSDENVNWTPEIKKKVGYVSENSSFYMNLKDFKHYFSKIKICKVYKDYKYNYIELTQKVNSYSLVKMTITNDTSVHGFVTLVQLKNKKAFPNLNFGIIRIILCKLINYNSNIGDYNVEYLSGKMGQERDIFEERIFEPGEYLIFTELNKNICDSPTVVSMYSNGNVHFEPLDRNNFPRILEKIYISSAKKQNKIFRFQSDGAPNCLKYSNTSPEGYTYIYIENNEEDTTLVENVNYTKFEGLKLLEPFSGTSYQVQVGPGQRQIVLIKQLELSGYNLIFLYHSYFQYGVKSLVRLTKSKGKKKYRKDPKLNIDLDIVVYVFKHSLGLCYYYENHTIDKRLEETLKLNNIIGIEIAGEHKGNDTITIKLNPGQSQFVELKANETNWSVQSSVSYKIENV